MLESRESTEVSEWLATYPNLKVVSRDGSQMYAKAIRTAHPDALQVSDRFHIFKGLAEVARQFILNFIPQRIAVPSDSRPAAIGKNSPKLMICRGVCTTLQQKGARRRLGKYGNWPVKG